MEVPASSYHIKPYHMNGLNLKLLPVDERKFNITVITGFMPACWEEEYGIIFGEACHVDAAVHRNTLLRMQALLRE